MLLDKLTAISILECNITNSRTNDVPEKDVEAWRADHATKLTAVQPELDKWNNALGCRWEVVMDLFGDTVNGKNFIHLNDPRADGTVESTALQLWGTDKPYSELVEDALELLDPDDNIAWSFIKPQYDTCAHIAAAYRDTLSPSEIATVLRAHRAARLVLGYKDIKGIALKILDKGLYPHPKLNQQLFANLHDIANRELRCEIIAELAVGIAADAHPGYHDDNTRALYDVCLAVYSLAYPGATPRANWFTDALCWHIVAQKNFTAQPLDIAQLLYRQSKYVKGNTFYAIDHTRKLLRQMGHEWSTNKVADHIWPIVTLNNALCATESKLEGELYDRLNARVS